MSINFWKMHGAGNDFILVDDRGKCFPVNDKKFIADICARRTGIGCEGLILVQKSETADFAMQFFNPDGNEASMCGNGARCIARLAYDLNIAGKEMQIATAAGVIRAEILPDNLVCLHLPPPKDYRHNHKLVISDGTVITYDFIDSGVPHVIVQTENLANYPVAKHGIEIVHHADFAPAQTNVNFIERLNRNNLEIRTFERGVEEETLACGTGITAAAVTQALGNTVQPPVKVHTAGGDTLVVDFDISIETIRNVRLTGPVAYVFKAELQSNEEVI
jgi:diaminopimelate epimerase